MIVGMRTRGQAARVAANWGLAQVKNDLDVKKLDPDHESVGWDLGSLRWAWNRVKGEVAPWWADNSKEAYSSGLADLARALDNWNASRNGTRKGRRVGFPKFKSARRDPGRVRFTTGAMRLEADRRTIVLPRIGGVRSKENTRRVQRHLAAGRAQILNMTLSQRIAGSRPARSTTATPCPTAHPADSSAKAKWINSWCARSPVNWWTATRMRPAISVTGRILPVVAQSGPRPHRYPGQPDRLVQAMAATPEHQLAPTELL